MTRPLIIVCDWIPPAYGAVGQYELARAHEGARQGRPTTLIGLGDGSGDGQEAVPDEASETQPKIVRLPAKTVRKSNLALRAVWIFTTNVRLIGATLGALRPRDQAEVKVTGSPPFLAYVLIALNALFLRRTLTYRMTDFYPETMLAAGKAGFLKPAVPFFHWLRRFANNLEVLSECQERRLVESGVARSRIKIIRDASPVKFPASSRPARPFPGNTVTLLYSGNLGIAHDVDTFAEAYRQHVQAGPNRVRLWLNATGAKVPVLTEFCRRHDLPIHVTPPVALSQLAGVLSTADVHLVTLGKPFWGYVIPSKIYACIESQKPVLYVGPEESDVHRLISQVTGCVSVRNDDVEACLSALNNFQAVSMDSAAAG